MSVSDGQVVVPTDLVLYKTWQLWRSGEENLRAVFDSELLDAPNGTQVIEIDFESTLQIDQKRIAHSFRISTPPDQSLYNPKQRPQYALLWIGVDDAWLQSQLFKLPHPLPLRQFYRNGQVVEAVLEGNETVRTVSGESWPFPGEVTLRRANLNIYGPDAKTVLASFPLAYRR
jgi:hypothetical protein